MKKLGTFIGYAVIGGAAMLVIELGQMWMNLHPH